MFKLDLEKAEEPENKLQTSTGLLKNNIVQKKHLLLLYYAKAIDCVDHTQQTVENYKEMRIPDCLTSLLRNLYEGQEAAVRTGQETKDWFQIGKRLYQGCILSPCLFNLYTDYIMRNAGQDEAQTGIKINGISITSDIQMTPPLWPKAKKN